MNERAERIALRLPEAAPDRSIDVTPYSAGLEVARTAPNGWSFGVSFDYGRAAMKWGDSTPEYPIHYFVEQESDVIQIQLTARRSLCKSCVRLVPFATGSAGAAHGRSSFLMFITPVEFPEYAEVRGHSEGWFPVATARLGLSGPLPGERWTWEAAAGYLWGRLNEDVPAEGSFRFPGEEGSTIEIETDLTGPSVWLGFGTRF